MSGVLLERAPRRDPAPSARRADALRAIARDREELFYVGGAIGELSHTLDRTRLALHRTAGALRWAALAASVLGVIAALRGGRRPPVYLLVTLAVQAAGAWREVRGDGLRRLER